MADQLDLKPRPETPKPRGIPLWAALAALLGLAVVGGVVLVFLMVFSQATMAAPVASVSCTRAATAESSFSMLSPGP